MDIIGVNEIGIGPGTLVFATTRLLWTRDTAAAHVQSSWGAQYRDVIILDPLNNRIETYNLIANPLPANKTALKNKLINAAAPADTDHDGLPDYWETWAYGNLSRNGTTPGANGLKTLQYWAHASTSPATGLLPGLPEMYFVPAANYHSVYYIRRRGTAFGLSVLPEFSNALTSWTTTGHGYEEWTVRNLYDGSGGELVEWRSTVPAPFRYARIKAVRP